MEGQDPKPAQPEPARLTLGLSSATLIMLVLVVVIAPLVGCFAFSPLLVAWGLQPYPLAAAIGVMAAEAIAVAALAFLTPRPKR